jgi:hypothetical protein
VPARIRAGSSARLVKILGGIGGIVGIESRAAWS